MSDITTKQIEIVLKGRDDGSLNLLGQAERRVTSLAQALRQGGDIGELSGIKKFGKNLGEFLGTSQSGTISTNAGQMRNQALAEYGETLKGVNEIEARAAAVDKARTGAMLERSNAANQLKRDLAEINALEKRQLSKGATGLLAGEYGPAEIKQEAAVSRAAAEKAYQDVLNRTVDVQLRAAKSDEDRRKALLAKAEAARQYAKQLDQINVAEANALKANGGGLARGIAIAGGVLMAVNAAGRLADAWDKANQKIAEGKIRSSEMVGELAKALPVVGGVVQQAENLLMVVTGTTTMVREANEEAAKWDKLHNEQVASRRNAASLASQYSSLNATGTDRIFFDSDERLTAIRAERKRAMAIGTINQVQADLARAEAAAIRKRETDLAEVEAKAKEDRAKKVAETMKIFESSRQSSIDALSDMVQGPRGEIRRLRDRTQQIVDGLRKQIDETRRTEPNWEIRDQRIRALQGAIDTEQTNASLRENGIIGGASKAIRDANNAAKEAQRQREEAARLKALETQQAARTSNFDGRGQTGFFNQSKSIEDSGKKTADNTKSIADTMKTVSDNIGKLFTSGALISL